MPNTNSVGLHIIFVKRELGSSLSPLDHFHIGLTTLHQVELSNWKNKPLGLTNIFIKLINMSELHAISTLILNNAEFTENYIFETENTKI